MHIETAALRLLSFVRNTAVGRVFPMAHSSTVVLESQLDWLTFTYRGDAQARALRNAAMDLQAMEARDGNDTTRWRLNGYEGFRTGRVRYGDRDNACLVQLSGQLADDWGGTFIPDATTITRCDLAVTVRDPPAGRAHGAEAHADLVAFHAAHPLSALPWQVSDANGGHTVYLGARRSPVFLRIYDKEAESRQRDDKPGVERYLGCWRYELECHDQAATVVARQAIIAGSRSAYVSGYMWDYLRAHGHLPPFTPTGEPVHRTGFRRRSDYQSRLRWFASDVAPAIRTAMGQGDPWEVINALGLAKDSNPPLT